MATILQGLCALIGLCILIPIVGFFSAADSLVTENENLRRENAQLRKKDPNSKSSGGGSSAR